MFKIKRNQKQITELERIRIYVEKSGNLFVNDCDVTEF